MSGWKTKEQQRKYQRRWYARRRADFFRDKRCVKCGSEEDLHLDHKDPSQKWTHRIWSYSATKRAAEIAKCQVLCYGCHREKTNLENHVRQSENCHCWICKREKRKMERAYVG